MTDPAIPHHATPANIEELEQLVRTLEADLHRVKDGSASVELLRAEVESLRNALGTPEAPMRLKKLHGALDGAVGTLETDAFKAADYVARIGRILGMS